MEAIDVTSPRYRLCLACNKQYMAKKKRKSRIKTGGFYSATRGKGIVIVDLSYGDLNPLKNSIIY